MIYWIIPYLVAYNASSSGDWKYGPEHVFKAEVYNSITIPVENSSAYSKISMDFVCRPMDSTLIQCRIDSAKVNQHEVTNGSDSRHHEIKDQNIGLDHIVFQMKFDKDGISRVWFLNNKRNYVINMIRAIIGTMNMGISIAGKKVGNYESQEKSVIGICDTNFVIKHELLSEKEKQNEIEIEGYEFSVPLLDPRTDDKTIIIEKDRRPSKCVKKTPYFFGSTEEADAKAGQQAKVFIMTSKSRFNLGEKSFSTYTETIGKIDDPYVRKSNPTMDPVSSANEFIRVSLQSIRPAKDEHWNNNDLANAGAGFEPGTPWPGRNIWNNGSIF